MSDLTDKQWDKEWARLTEEIQTRVTPFVRDTTEKKIARKKRALGDKFFFAATYFPHYIYLPAEHRDVWMHPDAPLDPVKIGFSEIHPVFFKLTEFDNKFHILAAFRESAKDTLIGKIDVIHKLVFELNWFTAIIAITDIVATSKIMPMKLEIENNKRLINDFGNLVGKMKWEQSEYILSNGRKVKSYSIDQTLRGQENFTHRVDYFQLNDIEDPTKSYNHALCMQTVKSIRQDKIMAVDSQRWTGIYLCNYISEESVTHQFLHGENIEHFVRSVFPVLEINPRKSKEDRAISEQCKAAGLPETHRSVWESRHPTIKLLKDWQDDPDTFEPEMMMKPTERKEKIFKKKDLGFYDYSEIAHREMVTWTFGDPSVTDVNDYKAVISIGVPIDAVRLEAYVLRASIRQESTDWFLNTTYEHYRAFHSMIIGFDATGFASLLEREYLALALKPGYGYLPIHKKVETERKVIKIARMVTPIRNKVLRFNPKDSDQAKLIEQFRGFPDPKQVHDGGIGDDGPDATADCWDLMVAFPLGMSLDYESVEKRDAEFEDGAY